MAPAFCALMVRNLSPTPVERVFGVWSGFMSRSARAVVGRSERSELEVFPSRPVWGEVDMWLSGSGGIGSGRVWDGEPGGECGNENGVPLGGRGVFDITGLLTSRGWAGSSGVEVGEPSSGDRTGVRLGVDPANGQ